MIKSLKKLLPTSLLFWISRRRYLADFFSLTKFWFRFDLSQSSLLAQDKRALLAGLLVTSHVVEKGITMPNCRLGFGYERVRDIINRTKSYIGIFSEDYIEIQIVLNILEQYLKLHEESNFSLPDDIQSGISSLLTYKNKETAKCKEYKYDDIFSEKDSYIDIVNSRHSIRWFSEKRVPNELIIKAVELAKKAPSSCNRQSINLYVLNDKEKIREVFNIQRGNRGFGDTADKLLLVTSNMKCYNYSQHSMALVDGGIFLYGLLLALQYYKISACTLNADLKPYEIKSIKNIFGFSDSEIPVAFIIVGYPPQKFKVPGSQRVNTDQICKFV